MNNKYMKQLKFLCDICNRNMDVFDTIDGSYDFWDNDDPVKEGYGFIFYGNKDNFQPIIKINYGKNADTLHITGFVENRNGNQIINGNCIAIYSMKIEYMENMTKEEIKVIDNRYRTMVKHIIDRWTVYNKENQLGYIENEVERLEF